jgi:hypothetical protein
MSTSTTIQGPVRRPLTMRYLGRPVSLYIDALAKRQHAVAVPQPGSDGAIGQLSAS